MEIDRTLCETCVFQEYYPTQKPCLTCLGGSPLRVTGDRYLKYTLTNGDYIRRMTDKELATAMAKLDCDYCPLFHEYCSGPCEEKILEWLKKEKDYG